jgi:hypothetical protein
MRVPEAEKQGSLPLLNDIRFQRCIQVAPWELINLYAEKAKVKME